MNGVSRPGKPPCPAYGSFAVQDKASVIGYHRDIAECLLAHVKDPFPVAIVATTFAAA